MAITFTVTLSAEKYLAKQLERDIAYETAELARFTASVAKDPGNAMEWGNQYFASAARVEVYRQQLARLDGGASIEKIARILLANVLSNTASRSHSTSPSSNQMDEERLSVRAKLLAMILEMEPEAENNAIDGPVAIQAQIPAE